MKDICRLKMIIPMNPSMSLYNISLMSLHLELIILMHDTCKLKPLLHVIFVVKEVILLRVAHKFATFLVKKSQILLPQQHLMLKRNVLCTSNINLPLMGKKQKIGAELTSSEQG